MQSTINRIITAVCLMAMAPLTLADSFAEDRAEIENLMSTYIFALDLKDAEAYAGTFTEDGIINHAGGIERGRDAIRAFIRASAARASASPPAVPSRHIMDNLELTVTGDTAKGRAYWTSMSVDTNGKAHISEYGFYDDEYRRVNGKWLFSYRLIVNEFRDGRQHGVVKATR